MPYKLKCCSDNIANALDGLKIPAKDGLIGSSELGSIEPNNKAIGFPPLSLHTLNDCVAPEITPAIYAAMSSRTGVSISSHLSFLLFVAMFPPPFVFFV